MNWDAVVSLARKDLMLVMRNPGVRMPLLIAPVLILIVLPLVLVLGGAGLAESSPIPMDPGTAFDALRDQVTGDAPESRTGLTGQARWTLFVLEFFLAPLYLLIPLIVATVIAADSFAGERERRTLESLLHTPTSDNELLIAKVVAAWLPAVTASTLGFVAYGILANILAWPYLGQLFFPTGMWLILALWVSPALAALGLGLMVVISSRVTSLQAAHQLGSLVVLPMLLLVIGQVSGTALLDVRLVLWMGTLLWAAAAIMLMVSARMFTRDQLARRL